MVLVSTCFWSPRIRLVADAKGMPMSHVSARAGISRRSMWVVMNGRASPTLDRVQSVAEVLDVEPLELLQGKLVRLPKR